ncbi:MFS transporter [Pseudorhodoferax sp.]|uniref:MFS transporter n=1 Tax=Pseudorhodoferax sp. TaxID=1993553 RepID=UPI002DD68CDA|nr:MFS transporter [Pseudorhodoferax sp.]
MPPSAPPQTTPRIGARLVCCLGLSQLLAWGAMHYLIAVFAQPITAELGWSAAWVQAGFSLALLVMAASSSAVGRWIDTHGGRGAMVAGCWAGALGCALLASTQHLPSYYLGWVLLGLGMRLALYDAAFAALAFLGGPAAKRAMSQITLFGGFASTLFWPLGQALADALGWRGALWVYALLLLLGSALHLAIPPGGARTGATAQPQAATAAARRTAPADTWLYGLVAVLVLAMQTGVAAHFLALVRGLGWDAQTAVTLSMLLGVGQFCGRAWVVAWGHRIDAIRLNLLPCSFLAGAYAVALLAGASLAGAAAFAFLYGAGNGIATITRGAMPLLLFDTTQYGRIVGTILRPAFVLAAGAPVAVALALQRLGNAGTLALGLAACAVLLAASTALVLRHPPSTATRRPP